MIYAIKTKQWILIVVVLSLIAACKTTKEGAIKVFEGELYSVVGVMDPLSCYCYQAAYLTTENGQKIALCFSAEKVPSCKKIQVEGNFVIKENAPEHRNVCSKGTKEVLIVTKYNCKS